MPGCDHWSWPVAVDALPYGYGIVDKDGAPYWDDACVCEDRDPIEEIVEELNDAMDDPRMPYRVVRLLYVEEDR